MPACGAALQPERCGGGVRGRPWVHALSSSRQWQQQLPRLRVRCSSMRRRSVLAPACRTKVGVQHHVLLCHALGGCSRGGSCGVAALLTQPTAKLRPRQQQQLGGSCAAHRPLPSCDSSPPLWAGGLRCRVPELVLMPRVPGRLEPGVAGLHGRAGQRHGVRRAATQQACGSVRRPSRKAGRCCNGIMCGRGAVVEPAACHARRGAQRMPRPRRLPPAAAVAGGGPAINFVHGRPHDLGRARRQLALIVVRLALHVVRPACTAGQAAALAQPGPPLMLAH